MMMHVLLLLFLVLTEIFFYFLAYKSEQRKRKHKVIIMGLIIFLFAALRATDVGIDVPGYVQNYISLRYETYEDILVIKSDRDPVFSIFSKFLGSIIPDPQFLLVVVGAIVAFAFSYLVYHQKGDVLTLFVLFIGFRLYAFTLTGLRQAIALAFCWIAFVMLQKKKTVAFIVLTLIASLFHASAVVFLITWPVYRYGKPLVVFLICSVFTVVDLLLNHALISSMATLVSGDRFDSYIDADQITSYSGGGTFYLYILFFVFIILAKNLTPGRLEDAVTFDKIFNVACIAMMVSIMCQNLPVFFRIAYYFMLPFYALLSPSVRSFFSKKDSIFIHAIIIVLMCLQYIVLKPGAGINEYHFFWR